MSVEENQGMKLRSGRVLLPWKSCYDYSDSDSDYNSYDYLCDFSDEEPPPLSPPPFSPPISPLPYYHSPTSPLLLDECVRDNYDGSYSLADSDKLDELIETYYDPEWDAPINKYKNIRLPKPKVGFAPPTSGPYVGPYVPSEERQDQGNETVEETTEKKVASKIDVPNGFGDEAGNFLEKFNDCYQDCFISHDQLNDLVKDFAKHLSWFPNNVPFRRIKKYCQEAYTHTLWKSFLDEKITDRQFVNLMRRYKKFGKKPKRL